MSLSKRSGRREGDRGMYRFRRRGGELRLVLETARDVIALADLDETYWLATSAPVEAFSCDAALLHYLDTDNDGRIRSADVKEALRWIARVLTSYAGIDARSDVLSLGALATADPEGRRLAACARRVLGSLGQDGGSLSLREIHDRARILARGDQNGDGIVAPEVVTEGRIRKLVVDIMQTIGSVVDVNGGAGVNEELLDVFLDEAREHLSWRNQVQASAGAAEGTDPWRILREGLPALDALGGRIDRYFDLCDAVSYAQQLGRPASAAAEPDARSDPGGFLERAPLAAPRADAALVLDGSVNPAYRMPLDALWRSTISAVLGTPAPTTRLERAGWERVKALLTRLRAARDGPKGERVARLGADLLQGVLQGEEAGLLRGIIRKDREAGTELSALRDLEFLVLAQRYLIDFANNFATLPDLYSPGRRSLLDAGRLVLDGQVFDFNLRVREPASHSAIARRSGIFLMYSEVVAGSGERFHIVTPVVGKRSADIYAEKRGVFFDRGGADHDARVEVVIENPVSLGEAVLAPFRRIGALIASAAERISAGAEKQIESTVAQATTGLQDGAQTGTVRAAGPASQAPVQAATPPGASGRVRDVLLTGGVTVAALGSSLAFIAKTISEMDWRHIVVSVGIVLVLILVPNLAIAHGRLRRRDLSILLEASGWATNGKIRISRGLARAFSPPPPPPDGPPRARRS